MPLAALLLSRDPSLLAVVRRGLEELAIRPEVCTAAPAATEKLSHRKFEAIIVDCDDTEGGRTVLQNLRVVPANKNSIVFAVVHQRTSIREAFEMGANFVLEKPVSPDRAVRSLRAAHPLIVRERRRSFRQCLDASILLQNGAGGEVRGRAVDLSEGGMAVCSPNRLPLGASVLFRFMLPDTGVWVDGRAQVVWTNDQGRAGLQFSNLRHDYKVELAQWLSARLDQEPTFAAQTIRPEPVRPLRRDLGLSVV